MPLPLDDIKYEYPVTLNNAYLNTGTDGPISRTTLRVIQEKLQREFSEGRINFDVFLDEHMPELKALRANFGHVLGADEDEIAITHHTTDGMNIAMWGINWQPGDEIITTKSEHPGGLLPIYTLAKRFGLTIRMVDVGDEDDALLDLMRPMFSARTRLVMLSHVSYQTSAVYPLAEVVALAHAHGALVCVDGAQSAGAIPLDMHALGVDFYAIPGQKWLCGPEGVGALYVRRDLISAILPTFVGFLSMRDFTSMSMSGDYIPAETAQRFEVGTVNFPNIYGMNASLTQLATEIGYDHVFETTQTRTTQVREVLAEIPAVTIHSPPRHAGLTTFSVDGVAADDMVAFLKQRDVLIRAVQAHKRLRVSTSFYNSEADLMMLAEGIYQFSKAN